ncbi:MAG: heme o synthase [Candidatus Thermoplasmatota archaeon]|nr:heme o synthase [Candidatus Thermoplasmatota archaeon]MCL5790437.1 heme o synthase [Candidatus Thermoplasmatota archaeon]
MPKYLSFSFLNDAFKLEITFLIDLVAVAGFFTVPNPGSHILLLIPLLISGTLASMAAGVFNNLYDIDIDSRMQRVSQRRSFVSHEKIPLIAIMLVFLAISSILALLYINIGTLIFIMAGFLSYAVLYTVMLKRRTDMNIVIGGIAGSFPALAGGAVLSGFPTVESIFVAGVVFLWTPTHFWSLAIKYTDDYKAAGIPMLPATRGINSTRKWILVNSSILMLLMVLPVFLPVLESSIMFRILAIPLGMILLVPSTMYYIRKGNVEKYRKLFSMSNTFLTVTLIVIMVSSLI